MIPSSEVTAATVTVFQGRDESLVQREIHDTRVRLRATLERVKAEANKISLRAGVAVEDLRTGRLTFHGSVKLEELLVPAAEIAALETKLVDLSRELGGMR